ncbi:hypothetical protein BOSE62_50206 [Bosea sp. 62]|nr:hypothetical protein BOSE46_110008 [Bosea sp. 46]CAD5257112.1 hypothetical protein BOSE21B_110044 [Bosea sp. 21B]CAD5283929.1 hypothetical protein BOSE7B_41170 [Bosea sp. 7B]VVT52323.1 hypothetical protein BOS5A_110666 [Bosea sp. EC-HK365B]VXB34827.1 hypothetical protein BOSE29B_110009 [Bosea sp. 29B]VXB78326.1 hypothetical protein BOSE125_150156 [Bosea sp. 125]VXC61165.1 hypothetical protein BOSE62_50206 [Bosea sp. 62]VXC90510.1 hypothetical protein BOSE127_70215 [Bosea sp. 127]
MHGPDTAMIKRATNLFQGLRRLDCGGAIAWGFGVRNRRNTRPTCFGCGRKKQPAQGAATCAATQRESG